MCVLGAGRHRAARTSRPSTWTWPAWARCRATPAASSTTTRPSTPGETRWALTAAFSEGAMMIADHLRLLLMGYTVGYDWQMDETGRAAAGVFGVHHGSARLEPVTIVICRCSV